MDKFKENTVKQNNQTNYMKISKSKTFKEMLAIKKRFIILTTAFFISFALLLPILAFYTDILIKPAFGEISWAWVFAFSQFVMTWAICYLYAKKADQFDEMAKQVVNRDAERS